MIFLHHHLIKSIHMDFSHLLLLKKINVFSTGFAWFLVGVTFFIRMVYSIVSQYVHLEDAIRICTIYILVLSISLRENDGDTCSLTAGIMLHFILLFEITKLVRQLNKKKINLTSSVAFWVQVLWEFKITQNLQPMLEVMFWIDKFPNAGLWLILYNLNRVLWIVSSK